MATIALLMHWRGLKQTDLAELTGMSKGQVSRYLAGETTPQLRQLFRIIDALDTDDLLFWYVFEQMRRIHRVVRPRLLGDPPRLDDPLLEAVLGSVLGDSKTAADGETPPLASPLSALGAAGLKPRPPLDSLTRRLIATVRDLADSGRTLSQGQRRLLETLIGMEDEAEAKLPGDG